MSYIRMSVGRKLSAITGEIQQAHSVVMGKTRKGISGNEFII